MARAGDELMNPVTGQRLMFLKTAAETAGELLEMETIYQPGGWPPGLHYHPIQGERFEVLAGALRVSLNGEDWRLGPGDVLVVEPGVVHEMWNDGQEWTRVNWQVGPALKTEQLFETSYGLARDGKVNARGLPNLLQTAVMLRAYDDEFRLATPPRTVQQLVFGLLSAIARPLGYRGHYARYSEGQRRQTGTA
jgi:quercetin dioxygenase-like cupin family protein